MTENTKRINDVIIKWIALLSAIGGIVFFVLKYDDLGDVVFKKHLREKQLQYYSQISEATSAIATNCDEKIQKDAKDLFYKLYFGPLATIESVQVGQSIKSFSDELRYTKEKQLTPCENEQLIYLSFDLASAIREDIAKSWHIDLPRSRAAEIAGRRPIRRSQVEK